MYVTLSLDALPLMYLKGIAEQLDVELYQFIFDVDELKMEIRKKLGYFHVMVDVYDEFNDAVRKYNFHAGAFEPKTGNAALSMSEVKKYLKKWNDIPDLGILIRGHKWEDLSYSELYQFYTILGFDKNVKYATRDEIIYSFRQKYFTIQELEKVSDKNLREYLIMLGHEASFLESPKTFYTSVYGSVMPVVVQNDKKAIPIPMKKRFLSFREKNKHGVFGRRPLNAYPQFMIQAIEQGIQIKDFNVVLFTLAPAQLEILFKKFIPLDGWSSEEKLYYILILYYFDCGDLWNVEMHRGAFSDAFISTLNPPKKSKKFGSDRMANFIEQYMGKLIPDPNETTPFELNVKMYESIVHEYSLRMCAMATLYLYQYPSNYAFLTPQRYLANLKIPRLYNVEKMLFRSMTFFTPVQVIDMAQIIVPIDTDPSVFFLDHVIEYGNILSLIKMPKVPELRLYSKEKLYEIFSHFSDQFLSNNFLMSDRIFTFYRDVLIERMIRELNQPNYWSDIALPFRSLNSVPKNKDLIFLGNMLEHNTFVRADVENSMSTNFMVPKNKRLAFTPLQVIAWYNFTNTQGPLPERYYDPEYFSKLTPQGQIFVLRVAKALKHILSVNNPDANRFVKYSYYNYFKQELPALEKADIEIISNMHSKRIYDEVLLFGGENDLEEFRFYHISKTAPIQSFGLEYTISPEKAGIME